MRSERRPALWILAGLLLAGRPAAADDPALPTARGAPAAAPTDGVAFLFDSATTGVRPGMIACLSRELSQRDPGARVLDGEGVRAAFFPWFEDVRDGFDPGKVTAVLSSRMGRARARLMGLRYIVFLMNANSDVSVHGPFGCGAAGGYGGCLGAAVMRRESRLVATVWDFDAGTAAVALEGHGESKDALLALGLPVWLPGGRSTKTLACIDMVSSIHRILHGDPDRLLQAVRPDEPETPAGEPGGPDDTSRGRAPLWPCLRADSTAGGDGGPAPAEPAKDGQGAMQPLVADSAAGTVTLADWVEWRESRPTVGGAPDGASPPRIGILSIGPEEVAFDPDGDREQRFVVPLTLLSGVAIARDGLPQAELAAGICRASFRVVDRNPVTASSRTASLESGLELRLAERARRAGSPDAGGPTVPRPRP